jgi:hypothetical protein
VIPYTLSEAETVHAQQTDYMDEYHRHLFGWLCSEIRRLRSDEWLEKAAEEINGCIGPDGDLSSRRSDGNWLFDDEAVVDILRKHRDTR